MIIDAPKPGQEVAMRTLWQEAFGDPEEFLDAFMAAAFSPERCLCLCLDGQVAAALYWFDCSYMERPVAYIYAVATAKAYRGRGFCHRLMEHTHAHLEKLGYAGAALVPGSKALFRLYEKLGYRQCGGIREFSCGSEDGSPMLREVNEAEYACLRRQLLPAGGVIQEGENLAFLQTQARLYAGSGFILAARREADTLHGIELLGDASAAPGIVQALGCMKGSFRTPGEAPFAMYRPLSRGPLQQPSYFGLAFDQ